MLPDVPKPETKQPAASFLVSDNDMQKNLVVNDVGRDTNRLFWSNYNKNAKIAFFVISLMWVGFFLYLFFTSPALNNSKDDTEQIYILIALLPAFLVGGLYAAFYNKVEKLFMQQFAAAHGLTYVGKGSDTDFTGGLFAIGHGHIISHLMTGSFQNHPVSLFFYQYTVGSGKSARTYHTTVLNTVHEHPLPPVLLLVDNQYFGGFDPKLSFNRPVKLKPELNLDAQFDLYCQEKYEIETLQIFTPAFIAKMLANWKNFNLEFSGNNLFVFKSGKILNTDELNNFFGLATYTVTAMEALLTSISGSVKALNELNPNKIK